MTIFFLLVPFLDNRFTVFVGRDDDDDLRDNARPRGKGAAAREYGSDSSSSEDDDHATTACRCGRRDVLGILLL